MPSSNPIDVWAVDLPDAFLQCRDFGHTWRPFRASINDDATFERVFRCGRCKTERQQTLSKRGEILGGAYLYTEGYLAPKGTERITSDGRNRLRLESTQRLLGHDEIER